MVKRSIAIGVVVFVLFALFAVMAPVRAEAQLMKDYVIHYTQGVFTNTASWRAASEGFAKSGFTASKKPATIKINRIHLASVNCNFLCPQW